MNAIDKFMDFTYFYIKATYEEGKDRSVETSSLRLDKSGNSLNKRGNREIPICCV